MKNIIGETNIEKLIAHMKPVLNHGDYVFCTVKDISIIPRNVTICEVKEKEGVTVVLLKEDAEHYDLEYAYIASWITLNIHSSLEAVGLTAAFSTELSKHNISCNVVAGYYHDHIFIDKKDSVTALTVLNAMTQSKS